jgi:hypothetical protein
MRAQLSSKAFGPAPAGVSRALGRTTLVCFAAIVAIALVTGQGATKSPPSDLLAEQARPQAEQPAGARIRVADAFAQLSPRSDQAWIGEWVAAQSAMQAPQAAEQPPQRARVASAAAAKPAAKKKAGGYGYYYERRIVQGDALDGEYTVTKRKCVPPFNMPMVCYMPQEYRNKIIVHAS